MNHERLCLPFILYKKGFDVVSLKLIDLFKLIRLTYITYIT